MFTSLTDKERADFLNRSADSFIPGYTGHCPTLKFSYGKGYGARTREILKELRSKRFYEDAQREKYEPPDSSKAFRPIERSRGQAEDPRDYTRRAPRYITGYTGFIPSLNFRYGKSFGRAADDSMCEFANRQKRLKSIQDEVDRMFRSQSAPKMSPIRNREEVKKDLDKYYEANKYKDHELSPDYPPTAGYTGHIPRVKGNEESLSKRYQVVVKRGLSMLHEERERRRSLRKAQNKVKEVVEKFEGRSAF